MPNNKIECTIEEKRKRVEPLYSLLEYKVDGKIDDCLEMNFLNSVCKDFNNGDELSLSIDYNMHPFLNYSTISKLDFAVHIEDWINSFMKICEANSLIECLDGGIIKYLYEQFFSNALTIYSNVLFLKINEEKKYIKQYNDNYLKDSNAMFLQFEFSEIEELIEEFINSLGYENTIYDKSSDELYEDFCIFLHLKR